jgi:hypothetical protein
MPFIVNKTCKEVIHIDKHLSELVSRYFIVNKRWKYSDKIFVGDNWGLDSSLKYRDYNFMNCL